MKIVYQAKRVILVEFSVEGESQKDIKIKVNKLLKDEKEFGSELRDRLYAGTIIEDSIRAIKVKKEKE